jgi:hypothetical protein
MITGSTDLGNGKFCLTVDHDPSSTVTDALAGSLIIDSSGNVWRKLDDGSTTNVILVESTQDRKEPTGHVDRTQSTISFVDGTRTFTIAPVSGTFAYYIKGKKYTVSSAQNLVILNTEGLHNIYFDGATLTESMTFTEALFTDYSLVCIIYWDTTNSKGIMVCDERHGIVMDGNVHRYLHLSTGAKWASGFLLKDFSVNQNGSLATHAEFSYETGVAFDEDLKIDLPTTILPAQLPIFYRAGANGYWRMDAPTNFPVKSYVGGSGRLAYNYYTGGSWGQVEAGQDKFVLAHIVATNSILYPVIAIQGRAVYSNVTLAKLGAYDEIAELSTNLPGPEMILLGAIIFQTSTSYSNSPKARVRSTDQGENYIDFRGYIRINVEPPSQANVFLGISYSFSSDLGDFLTTNSISWVAMANIIFQGRSLWSPSRLAMVLSRSKATGTCSIRVYDVTNSVEVAIYQYSQDAKFLHEVSFDPANLPLGECLLEVQAKIDNTGNGQPRLHYVLLT